MTLEFTEDLRPNVERLTKALGVAGMGLEPPILGQKMADWLEKAGGERGACRGCSAPLWWFVHGTGARAPYTEAALNHFADCPRAPQFRRTNGEK